MCVPIRDLGQSYAYDLQMHRCMVEQSRLRSARQFEVIILRFFFDEQDRYGLQVQLRSDAWTSHNFTQFTSDEDHPSFLRTQGLPVENERAIFFILCSYAIRGVCWVIYTSHFTAYSNEWQCTETRILSANVQLQRLRQNQSSIWVYFQFNAITQSVWASSMFDGFSGQALISAGTPACLQMYGLAAPVPPS